MTNDERIKRRICKRLKRSESKMNSFRFFRDYSEGYRYTLCDKNDRDSFVFVRPEGAHLEKLLRHKYYHDLSYEMEGIIERTISSLMIYGKAYIYIIPEYKTVKGEDDKDKKVLEAIELHDVHGVVSSRSKENIEFWRVGYSDNLIKCSLDSSGFVELRMKDIGFSNRQFVGIARKLNRYDITASSSLLVSKVDGYDFSEHMHSNTVNEFKLTRTIGWLPKTDGLTDSQILYRRMLQYKFKLRMMNYVIDRINNSLLTYLGSESEGILTIKHKAINCDEVWEKYEDGRLTASELSKLLF